MFRGFLSSSFATFVLKFRFVFVRGIRVTFVCAKRLALYRQLVQGVKRIVQQDGSAVRGRLDGVSPHQLILNERKDGGRGHFVGAA